MPCSRHFYDFLPVPYVRTYEPGIYIYSIYSGVYRSIYHPIGIMNEKGQRKEKDKDKERKEKEKEKEKEE